MSNCTTLKVNQEHISRLLTDYAAATTLLQSMKSNLTEIDNYFGSYYQGLADEIEPECITKYIEHLDFLEACCTANQTFISTSTGVIISVDNEMAQTMNTEA